MILLFIHIYSMKKHLANLIETFSLSFLPLNRYFSLIWKTRCCCRVEPCIVYRTHKLMDLKSNFLNPPAFHSLCATNIVGQRPNLLPILILTQAATLQSEQILYLKGMDWHFLSPHIKTIAVAFSWAEKWSIQYL